MKILVYCKNTEGNRKALDIAVKHAKAFNASVDLVYCLSDGSETPIDAQENAEKQLNEHIESLFKPQGIECKSKVIMTTLSHGEAIVRYAEQNKVDEIIMSIKQRSKVGKLFFGSSTQFIILEAPCQTVTIK